MKRTMSIISLSLAVALTSVMFTACPGFFGPPKDETSKTPTLAESFAAEWESAALSGTASPSSRSIRAIGLNSAQIAAIKTRALTEITNDGLSNSTKMDLIIPSFIGGIEAGVNLQFLDTSTTSAIYQLTATAVVTSAGKVERVAMVSASVTIQQVMTIVAADTAAAVSSSISDPTQRAEAVASTLGAAVTALNGVSSVSSANVGNCVKAMVQGAVESSLVGEDNPASLVQAITAGAMVAAAGLDTVDAAVVNAIAGQVISAVSAGVATAATNDTSIASGATEILTAVAAGVTKANADTTVEIVIDSAGVGSAISDGIGSGSNITAPTETEIGAVISETAPVAVATANPATLSAAGSVSLSGTGSTASGVEYLWVQVGGPAVTITGEASLSASVALSLEGTYVFNLRVSNVGGYLSASDDATIILDIPAAQTESAAYMIQQGISALGSKNFDGARTSFHSALAKDPADADAMAWSAFMDMAALSIQTDIVSLMKTRIGLAGYPSTLNELLSDTWFDQTWYGTSEELVADEYGDYIRGTFTPTSAYQDRYMYIYDKYGNYVQSGNGTFAPSATGLDYVYEGSVSFDTTNLTKYDWDDVLDLTKTTLLPRLQTPSTFNFLVTDTGNPEGSVQSYVMVLLANVLSRNPAGLNDAIDLVLSGAYGTAFEAIYTSIMGMDNSKFIAVPTALIQAYSGGEVPEGTTIQIGVPELKLFAAQMKMQKSFLQLLASYNMTYPVSAFGSIDMDSDLDTDMDGLPDSVESLMASTPNPVEAGFLGDRSQTTRTAAKTSMLAALDALASPLTAMTEAHFKELVTVSASAFEYPQDYLDIIAAEDEVALQAAEYAVQAKAEAAKLATAISGGTAMALDMDEDGVDDSSFNPAALYASAIFSLPNLFETTTTGFQVYGADYYYYGEIDMSTVATATSSSECILLKLKEDSFEALYPGSYDMFALTYQPVDAAGNYYIPLGGAGSPGMNTAILDWLTK